jgi:hypothetical protein
MSANWHSKLSDRGVETVVVHLLAGMTIAA